MILPYSKSSLPPSARCLTVSNAFQALDFILNNLIASGAATIQIGPKAYIHLVLSPESIPNWYLGVEPFHAALVIRHCIDEETGFGCADGRPVVFPIQTIER